MSRQDLPAAEPWDRAPFDEAAGALRGEFSKLGYPYKEWHQDQQIKHTLHPCVINLLAYKPLDFSKVVNEWPHVSDTDPTRLAYTRSDADGAADRQLITSVGKYLARHWPHVSDHARRDVQALFTPDTMHFVYTTPEMIVGVETGPRSCMAAVAEYLGNFKPDDSAILRLWMEDPRKPQPDWSRHPYSSYMPEFGWHMALRVNPQGRIDGRALCLTVGDSHQFVRTYRRHAEPGGWSETDFALQAWLTNQKYVLSSGWPEGARLRLLPKDGSGEGLYAPYLDGNRRGVSCADGSTGLYKITYGSHEYWCEGASGIIFPVDGGDGDDENDDEDDGGDTMICPCCGTRVDCENTGSVGRSDDQSVCTDCIESSYTWVRGRSRHGGYTEYYVEEDGAQSVLDRDYSVDIYHLPEDVIQTIGGDYAEMDDCVCIDDDWYHLDDTDVVHLACDDDEGKSFMLRADAYQADDSSWWPSHEKYLEHNPEPAFT